MWFRWVAAIVLLFLIGILLMRRDNEVQRIEPDQIVRSARNIIMHEKRNDSDVLTTFRAQRVIEQKDHIVTLADFEISQSDGLRIAGVEADYDMERSVLQVKGPVTVDTNDGRRAFLDGLVWDRQSQKATTDNPVKVVGAEGIIEAERAEFHEGFSLISFYGGVHAKISQDILYN